MVSLLEQLALINNKSIEQVMGEVCTFFPKEFTSTCQFFVEIYGADVIKHIEMKYGPDVTCLLINFCQDSQCRLFPKGYEHLQGKKLKKSEGKIRFTKPKLGSSPPWFVLSFFFSYFMIGGKKIREGNGSSI